MKLPLLSELLDYENDRVIRYFCHHHPDISTTQAKQLLCDLLAWMWLNAYRKKNNQTTYLFGPLLILDSIWHSFILHTFDYFTFCQTFFNQYFHHTIEPIGSEHRVTAEELSDFLHDCFNHLGEAWVDRYFPLSTKAERYSIIVTCNA